MRKMSKLKKDKLNEYYAYNYNKKVFTQLVIKPYKVKENAINIIGLNKWHNNSPFSHKVFLSTTYLEHLSGSSERITGKAAKTLKRLFSLVSVVNTLRLKWYKFYSNAPLQESYNWKDIPLFFILSDKDDLTVLYLCKSVITKGKQQIDMESKVEVIKLKFNTPLKEEYGGFSFNEYSSTINDLSAVSELKLYYEGYVAKIFKRLGQTRDMINLTAKYFAEPTKQNG